MRVSRSARAASQVAVLALSLAGIGAAGTASASAAVHPETANAYNCTGSAPEVCVGVNYSGTYVTTMTAQVKLSGTSSVYYHFTGPNYAASSGTSTYGSGWAPQVVSNPAIDATFFVGAQFCATAYVNGGAHQACVNLP